MIVEMNGGVDVQKEIHYARYYGLLRFCYTIDEPQRYLPLMWVLDSDTW